MKKLIFLFAFGAGFHSYAQQNLKSKHMTITVIDDHVAFRIGRQENNVLITRDDTAQVQKLIDLDPHVKAREEPAAFESLMMKLLKPYYDDNWKLITATIEFVPSSNTELFRYYFVKE